jgi:hypothetical protein
MDNAEIERLYYKLQKKDIFDKEQIIQDIENFLKVTKRLLNQEKSPVFRYQFSAFFAKIMIFTERICCRYKLDQLIDAERQKELERLKALITPPKELTWQEKFAIKKNNWRKKNGENRNH